MATVEALSVLPECSGRRSTLNLSTLCRAAALFPPASPHYSETSKPLPESLASLEQHLLTQGHPPPPPAGQSHSPARPRPPTEGAPALQPPAKWPEQGDTEKVRAREEEWAWGQSCLRMVCLFLSLPVETCVLSVSLCVSLSLSVSLFLSLSVLPASLCLGSRLPAPKTQTWGQLGADGTHVLGTTTWRMCKHASRDLQPQHGHRHGANPSPTSPPGPSLLVWPRLSSPPSSYLYYTLPMSTHRCSHSASRTGGPWILTVEEGRRQLEAGTNQHPPARCSLLINLQMMPPQHLKMSLWDPRGTRQKQDRLCNCV